MVSVWLKRTLPVCTVGLKCAINSDAWMTSLIGPEKKGDITWHSTLRRAPFPFGNPPPVYLSLSLGDEVLHFTDTPASGAPLKNLQIRNMLSKISSQYFNWIDSLDKWSL
ncbi:hypothetical protein CEXT_408381 [Caerostris extrusa]|uniref:Uncharacterized protein n=1 Tax=Caerostris extrusa TaxID=172846 RepID=A0AAV4SGD2_CAEEX|nr:hypothetical protein CEXT_408381 [Caerostris extrusa]